MGDVQPEGRGLAPDTVKAPASEHPSTVKTFGVAAPALLLYLLRSTPFCAFFHGLGFWSRLPVWLQGPRRGALGVLMDRSGNSLDRSVRLVRLLALTRFDARIVRAKLPAAESAKLLAGSPNPFPAAPPEDDAGAKQRRDLKEEASRISKLILGKAGPLSLASAGANESMHYWVQFNDGKAWADLDPALASPRQSRAQPEGNPLALFAEAARQGIGTIGLHDPNDAALANYPISTREMMRMDLQAGQCVIAPSKPVLVDGQPRLGWWRVDPASAQTVGEMDTGLLQETTEYSTTESVNGIRITRFHRVRISPEVRSWAEHAIRNRGNTSWSQWENLLSYGQKMLDTTAYLGF